MSKIADRVTKASPKPAAAKKPAASKPAAGKAAAPKAAAKGPVKAGSAAKPASKGKSKDGGPEGPITLRFPPNLLAETDRLRGTMKRAEYIRQATAAYNAAQTKVAARKSG